MDFVAGQPDANYNYPWFVVGLWQIGMSAKTARSIARRAPVEEFGYHENAVEIPCNVGPKHCRERSERLGRMIRQRRLDRELQGAATRSVHISGASTAPA